MVAAMYTSYNVVSGAYKQVSDKAKISGSSRDLVTMIMRDIRMAGFRYYENMQLKNFLAFIKCYMCCYGLRLTERNYILFNTGFDGDEANSHAPLVIRKNVAKDAPSLHNPFDTCCDSIEIIYEDFSYLQNKISFNHIKYLKFHTMQLK